MVETKKSYRTTLIAAGLAVGYAFSIAIGYNVGHIRGRLHQDKEIKQTVDRVGKYYDELFSERVDDLSDRLTWSHVSEDNKKELHKYIHQNEGKIYGVKEMIRRFGSEVDKDWN